MALNDLNYSPVSNLAYMPNAKVKSPLTQIGGSDSKPKSNIGFNKTTFALFAGVNTYNAIVNAILQSSAARMQAEAYESQARMAQGSFAIENRYDNIALGGNIQDINDYYNKFAGAQRAADAASGFTDVSVGDKRLFADTERNKEQSMYNANMQAYYTAFEKQRQANMQTIHYRAQAKIARQQAKYASGWGMYSNILTGIISAAAGSVTSVKPEITSAKVG